jgi:hypothetical protein
VHEDDPAAGAAGDGVPKGAQLRRPADPQPPAACLVVQVGGGAAWGQERRGGEGAAGLQRDRRSGAPGWRGSKRTRRGALGRVEAGGGQQHERAAAGVLRQLRARQVHLRHGEVYAAHRPVDLQRRRQLLGPGQQGWRVQEPAGGRAGRSRAGTLRAGSCGASTSTHCKSVAVARIASSHSAISCLWRRRRSSMAAVLDRGGRRPVLIYGAPSHAEPATAGELPVLRGSGPLACVEAAVLGTGPARRETACLSCVMGVCCGEWWSDVWERRSGVAARACALCICADCRAGQRGPVFAVPAHRGALRGARLDRSRCRQET